MYKGITKMIKVFFWGTCGGCGASYCTECNSGGQFRIKRQEGIGAC